MGRRVAPAGIRNRWRESTSLRERSGRHDVRGVQALPDRGIERFAVYLAQHQQGRALQGRQPAETTGEDNLRTLELVFACYDSANNSKSINIVNA